MEPLFVGGLVVSVLTAGFILWGSLRKVVVPRVGSWEVPPVVRFEVGVDADDVKKATDWWLSKGHVLIVRADPTPAGRTINEGEICVRLDPAMVDKKHPPTVRNATVVSEGHGYTERRMMGDQIVHAQICLYRNDALVLAHELGHALGYGHPRNAPTGHMMNGGGSPGWDDPRGLEIK